MPIDAGNKVGDLAIAIPGARRVFEELGIDYCCGGGKSLSEACSGAGKSLPDVLEALERGKEQPAAKPSEDWQSRPLAELTAYIVEKHHGYTKRELERIERLVEKVVSVHAGNHPELLKVRDTFKSLKTDLIAHMLKEEQVLFPRIEQLEGFVQSHRTVPAAFLDAVRNPVRVMMMEHDAAGDLLRVLRSVSGNYAVPPDGCISYKTLYQTLQEIERDLHQHIHLENNILFPRTVQLKLAG